MSPDSCSRGWMLRVPVWGPLRSGHERGELVHATSQPWGHWGLLTSGLCFECLSKGCSWTCTCSARVPAARGAHGPDPQADRSAGGSGRSWYLERLVAGPGEADRCRLPCPSVPWPPPHSVPRPSKPVRSAPHGLPPPTAGRAVAWDWWERALALCAGALALRVTRLLGLLGRPRAQSRVPGLCCVGSRMQTCLGLGPAL